MHLRFVATTTFLFLVACLLFRATRAFTPSSSVFRTQPSLANGLSTGSTHQTSPRLFSRGAPIVSVYNSDEHDEEWLKRELAALEQNDDSEIKAGNATTDSSNRATRASVGTGRAGGRTRRVKTKYYPTSTKSSNRWNNWWIKAGIPVLAIAILVKALFGGGDTAVTSTPSVYYYKSSYYESRVYTGNGNMERTAKSSVESNVPSLLEGQKLLQQSSQRPLLREDSPTSEYTGDATMNQRELDAALIKVQQAMFSDWY